jgi:hypothetical protein
MRDIGGTLGVMRRQLLVLVLLLSGAGAAGASETPDSHCRPYFRDACSQAIGDWLPRVPQRLYPGRRRFAPTSVNDEIVDPAGAGEPEFLSQRGVVNGTFFVYGTAGPPRGHLVYDSVHRIAFYDEGCCSWHHVVVVANVDAPPKRVATRTLTGLRTRRGIALGDAPSRIRTTYGPAPLRAVLGRSDEATLAYTRPITFPGVYSPCDGDTTFLFERGRLIAMDFTDAC